MIFYISYGVTKSASTFAYQLTEEILRNAGYRPARLATYHNYTDPINGAAIESVRSKVGSCPIVIKTHGAPDSKVLELVDSSAVFASVILRDPRDIALSMLDHGVRCRRTNMPGFEKLYSLDDVLPNLDDQFNRLKRWTNCANVLFITYNELCFSTEAVVEKIAKQLNLGVKTKDVLRRFRRKSLIGNFNRGIKDRHVYEMSWENQTRIIERYRDIYIDYLRMADVKACTAAEPLRPAFRIDRGSSAVWAPL
jgi:Sulfotransferase domain